MVLGPLSGPKACVAEQPEQSDEPRNPDHAQLLADHGGDHVRVGLGQVEGLLHPVAEPDAEDPAGAEGDLRLSRLKASAGGVGARMQEAGQPRHPVGLYQHRKQDKKADRDADQGEVAHPGSAGDHRGGDGKGDDDRRAEVRFEHDQQTGEPGQH